MVGSERLTMAGIEKVFRPRHNATACPGQYVLDLYCKYENPDHTFEGFPVTPSNCQTRGQALRKARAAGWLIHRDGTATCPRCAKLLAAGSSHAR